MKAELQNLYFDISQGLSDAKKLKLNLEKLWQWRKTLRWVYQQFEQTDGYDSIIIRFVKFMIAIKETSRRDYEMLRFAIDYYLDNYEVKGFPIKQCPLLDLLTRIQTDTEKAKKIALAV